MREILFRGKRLDNGEWIEGAHMLLDGEEHRIATSCLTNESRELLTVCAYPVDPETIGQYTGLQDKNGAKIFEGDIVKWRFKRVWQEQYHIAEVIWRQSKCGWRLNTAGDTTKMRDDIEYEILGNIYDNPELLEVKP